MLTRLDKFEPSPQEMVERVFPTVVDSVRRFARGMPDADAQCISTILAEADSPGAAAELHVLVRTLRLIRELAGQGAPQASQGRVRVREPQQRAAAAPRGLSPARGGPCGRPPQAGAQGKRGWKASQGAATSERADAAAPGVAERPP